MAGAVNVVVGGFTVVGLVSLMVAVWLAVAWTVAAMERRNAARMLVSEVDSWLGNQ